MPFPTVVNNDPTVLLFQDEYKFDRSTRIPRKEVDLLINEIITAYDLDQDGMGSAELEGATTASARDAVQFKMDRKREEIREEFFETLPNEQVRLCRG